MEGVVALYFLNLMLLQGVTAIERARRQNLIHRWIRGELSMEELLWLKRQVWFRRAFAKVTVDVEKKEN